MVVLPLGPDPVTERGGGVNQWHNNFIKFSFNAINILTQYFIVEPNWENHKHFSINCKILFYMLHRRKMFFLFNQRQLIRMHPHPFSPTPTGRRLRPLVYSATNDREAPTPSVGTNLPLHHPTTLIFWIWTNFCIKSLLHISLLLWLIYILIRTAKTPYYQHSSSFI